MSRDIPDLHRYEVTDPPLSDLPEFARWAQDELRKIQILLNTLADGQIEKTYVVPDKLRDGMIRFADGSSWNPGSGRGIYYYDLTSTSWVKLG